jgi:hypothetical protein
MTWSMLRVSYHDADKTALLRDAVGPFLSQAKASDLVSAGYFQRDWVRGPHVRVHVDGDVDGEGRPAPALQRLAADVIGRFLSRQPSTAVVVEDDVRSAYAELARAEWREEPFLPLVPDNRIDPEPDATSGDRYGGDEALAIARTLYDECTSSVLDAIALPTGERVATTVGWMVLAVDCIGARDGARGSYLSFRSHVEGFLHQHDRDGTMRAAFERSFQRQRDLWREAIHAARSTSARPVVARVGAALDRAHEQAYDLAHSCGLQGLAADGDIDLDDVSEFHRLSVEALGRDHASSPGFLARRFTLNLLYHLLLQAGIQQAEKHLLCYAVAAALDEDQFTELGLGPS